MYEDLTQNYDTEIHEEYLIRDTPFKKRAVRAICKSQRLAHSAPYFQWLKILTVNEICLYTLDVSQFV